MGPGGATDREAWLSLIGAGAIGTTVRGACVGTGTGAGAGGSGALVLEAT